LRTKLREWPGQSRLVDVDTWQGPTAERDGKVREADLSSAAECDAGMRWWCCPPGRLEITAEASRLCAHGLRKGIIPDRVQSTSV
jgi:hypothetical protein